MAITENNYTGNGSTTNYSFSFPYLAEADIKVTLDGSATTAYSLANATTVSFNTAPANGVAIRIYRETDTTNTSATFYPGSAIRAQDLNENFTQSLYVGQESENNVNSALTTAGSAFSTADTALTNANAAVSTANTAATNAASAVTTANTASTNANTAVTTANSAASDAATALSTANTALSTANTAISTANTASTNASSAVSTANTASTNASAAVTTANAANSAAASAVSTANSANTTATAANTTANSANTTANAASTTATAADTKASAAIAAVASSVNYTPVTDVANIPASPANNTYIEIADSTGLESYTPLAGMPAGFIGDGGLSVRLRYTTAGSTWNWLNYYANNSDARYLKLTGGTLTGQIQADDSTSASTPGYAFDGDTNTGIGRPGADELALITGGTARLTIDPAGAVAVPGALSQGGDAVVVTTDSRLSDTRTPTDASVTNAKVATNAAISGTKIVASSTTVRGTVQLTDSTSSTSTTTAATPNSVKTAYDLAIAALPKAGGTMTGNITFNVGQTFPTSGISAASTSAAGIVQLSDSTSSTSSTTAATSAAVKATYDFASIVSTTANAALPKAGGTISGNVDNSGTGYFDLPAGTTAQRPGTANSGMVRYNSDLGKFEGYTTAWGSLGGGATGGGSDEVFLETSNTVTQNYTLSTNKNAVTAGPVSINSGVTVTVPSGQSWSIV